MNQKPKFKDMKIPDKIGFPDILKIKPKGKEVPELDELQAVADAFQPLVKEDTFAYYLVHGEGDEAHSAGSESVSVGPEIGLTVDTYIERLLTAEKSLFVYCGQRSIAGRIQSGQYLMDVIRTFGKKESIFGDSIPSHNVAQYYDKTLSLLEAESKKHSVDKEHAFTILYNLLLVAQNVIASTDQSSEVVFSCTDIDLPAIFSSIENRVSPKVSFQKQCELAMQHFREKPRERSKECQKAIEQFFAFGYFKMASAFVVERVKRLGIL